jgi:hypothetical protein
MAVFGEYRSGDGATARDAEYQRVLPMTMPNDFGKLPGSIGTVAEHALFSIVRNRKQKKHIRFQSRGDEIQF